MYLYLYLRNLLQEQEGQDIVEYAILLGLISIVAYVAIAAAGTSIKTMWSTISGMVGGLGFGGS